MLGTKELICTWIGCSLLPLLSQFNSSLKCSWQPDKLQVTKQMHLGMESSKTNQTRWEWHHNTFPPSLHHVPFCQLCTPQSSLHALNLFTPTKWTLYSALLTPQPQATFNVDKPSAHLATGCQVGACAGIVEPFRASPLCNCPLSVFGAWAASAHGHLPRTIR